MLNIKKTTLLLLLLLSSCSFKSLVVHFIDSFAVDKISAALHLYPKQEKLLEQQVKDLLNRPQTKKLANDLSLQITNFQLKAQIEPFFDFLALVYQDLAMALTPILLKQFATMSEKQIDMFEKSLQKNINESLEKLKDYRSKKLKSFLETIIGSLTKQQVKLIKSYREKFIERSKFRLKLKQELNKEMIKILREQKQIETISKLFKDYEKKIFAKSQVLKKFYSSLYQSLTPAQLKRLEQKLGEVKAYLKLFVQKKY